MIERKQFGKTGHNSSRTLFGAASLSDVTQEEADQTLEVLLKHEVNHIDTAASYGDGEAEKRIGPWMAKHRDDFFLATKTGERTAEGAKRDFYGSLERLQVDSVDLIQLHNLVDPDEWKTAMGSGGALEQVIKFRDQGLVQYIGVTGHGMTAPKMHQQSLDRFDFTSVLLPYNYIFYKEPHYRSDFEDLVALCRKRGVAVQIIKSIARRPWPGGERKRSCWYEPFEEPEDLQRAVNWLLSGTDFFLNTVGDINVMAKVLEAAEKLGDRPTDEEMDAMARDNDMQLIFQGMEGISSS